MGRGDRPKVAWARKRERKFKDRVKRTAETKGAERKKK